MKKIIIVLLVAMLFTVSGAFAQQHDTDRQPIIDMHMHTYQWNRYGGDPPPPIIFPVKYRLHVLILKP